MISAACENFHKEVGGLPYAAMMKAGQGVPTVKMETDFHAPARLGEVLEFHVQVERLGRSSILFKVTAWEGGVNRLTARMTQAFVQDLKARSWPDDVRTRIEAFMA